MPRPTRRWCRPTSRPARWPTSSTTPTTPMTGGPRWPLRTGRPRVPDRFHGRTPRTTGNGREHDAHGAALDALDDTAGPQALDELAGLEHSLASVRIALDDDDTETGVGRARRDAPGHGREPDLRRGIRVSLVFAALSALGRLLVPVLVQIILDHGILDPHGFRPAFTYSLCAVGAVLVVAFAFLQRATYIRFLGRRAGARRPTRARVPPHPPPVDRRAHRFAQGRASRSRHERHRDARALVQWGAMSWISTPR